jgi:2-methylisocitrate lyase-like PEP mutase family enzyme
VKPPVWDIPEPGGNLVIPGVWDVVSAAAAKAAGASCALLAGSSLATAHGLPDLGLLGPEEIARAAFEVVDVTGIPIMVDAETGGASPPMVARFMHRLLEAGVGAVLIEDQVYTGQSIGSHPALCGAEEMCRRIAVAKDATHGDIRVLARTDVLGHDWNIDETVRRLSLYLASGADWVTAAYVRSKDELLMLAEVAPGRALSINGRGSTGYVPTLDDVRATGLRAHVMGGQERVAMKSLLESYRLTMEGRFSEMQSHGITAAEFADLLNHQRYESLA